MILPEKLQQKLDKRHSDNSYRKLKVKQLPVDFCSNDYLGLARSASLRKAVTAELLEREDLFAGATGSRLLSGNHAETEALELSLASFHRAEAALLFNSGYVANSGFFSAVPQRHDTILYDDASHASIKEGIRLSFANAYSFRHNALEDLKTKLKKSTGTVYVAVEALYSMHGDLAPLPELASLCKKHGAYLVVDEAHSNGIYGNKGEGLVAGLGLENQVFARILTFGKALGAHGAIVAGSSALREYLINFSRPFIYTTALPLHTIITLKHAYQLLPEMQAEREHLKTLSVYLKKVVSAAGNFTLNAGQTPIHALSGFSPENLNLIAQTLQNEGYDVRPIFSPTVPQGSECLRIITHAYNTTSEIDNLATIISKFS
jgi:8-amino-7-oxononanoate synthase